MSYGKLFIVLPPLLFHGDFAHKKNQTTVPKKIREVLRVGSGDEIEWKIIKEIVVVDSNKEIKNPVEFLTSQVKFDVDTVKLIKNSREDFK